jgi:hypothetical protein
VVTFVRPSQKLAGRVVNAALEHELNTDVMFVTVVDDGNMVPAQPVIPVQLTKALANVVAAV